MIAPDSKTFEYIKDREFTQKGDDLFKDKKVLGYTIHR